MHSASAPLDFYCVEVQHSGQTTKFCNNNPATKQCLSSVLLIKTDSFYCDRYLMRFFFHFMKIIYGMLERMDGYQVRFAC